jgi:hypothetical protein
LTKAGNPEVSTRTWLRGRAALLRRLGKAEQQLGPTTPNVLPLRDGTVLGRFIHGRGDIGISPNRLDSISVRHTPHLL